MTRQLCVNCGLLAGERDLTGCTRDTLQDHDFMDPDTRPFQGWTFDDLAARYGRARLKASSSAREFEHLRACPAAGIHAVVTAIYEQKAIKRTRLAEVLWTEMQVRISDGLDGVTVMIELEDATPEQVAASQRWRDFYRSEQDPGDAGRA